MTDRTFRLYLKSFCDTAAGGIKADQQASDIEEQAAISLGVVDGIQARNQPSGIKPTSRTALAPRLAEVLK